MIYTTTYDHVYVFQFIRIVSEKYSTDLHVIYGGKYNDVYVFFQIIWGGLNKHVRTYKSDLL